MLGSRSPAWRTPHRSPAATGAEMEFQPTMVARVPVLVGLAIVIGVAVGSRPVRAQDPSRADTAKASVYGGERFRLDALMPLRRGNARISLFHRQPDDPAQPD